MNEITQDIIEEFKLRLKLDGNDEDMNLKFILEASVEDLISKTGEYDITVSKRFKELVFERSRYVYNDALEFFDTNFVSQIANLSIMNSGVVSDII